MASAVADPDPVLYYEHIALYRDPRIKQLLDAAAPAPIPLGKAALRRSGDHLAIVSYGAFVHVALRVAEALAGDGIEASVLDLRTLVPLDREAVLAVARRCHKVLIIHEDSRTGGIGESLAAIIQEEAFECARRADPHRRRAGHAGAVLAAARGVLSAERGADRARGAAAGRLLSGQSSSWPPTAVTHVLAARPRLESVDVVRGAIMIVMALDHTRDFFGVPGISPTNVARAGAALFFTRWITHFCAPVFFLLTGTGAYLSLRKKSIGALSRFLFTRGLWLIVLELVVLRCLGYQFNVDYRVTMLIVLWALGWSMITLSALVHLPLAAITAFGLVLIAGAQPAGRRPAGDGVADGAARSRGS